MERMNWEPIEEMRDDDTNEMCGYACKINSKGYLSITKEARIGACGEVAHTWSVDASEFGPDSNMCHMRDCKTFASAKRWATQNMGRITRHFAD